MLRSVCGFLLWQAMYLQTGPASREDAGKRCGLEMLDIFGRVYYRDLSWGVETKRAGEFPRSERTFLNRGRSAKPHSTFLGQLAHDLLAGLHGLALPLYRGLLEVLPLLQLGQDA